jgi:hypothetical protein
VGVTAAVVAAAAAAASARREAAVVVFLVGAISREEGAGEDWRLRVEELVASFPV